jgi:eukaryotic-like serine/threonine-protein kinase
VRHSASAMGEKRAATLQLMPGYRLDRYELVCPIARGGMATVWFARLLGKHGFERQCAIKAILPEYAADEAFRSMFLDEARLASRIEHPNVAKILELGEEHGVLFMAMEWVDGYSLSKLLRTALRGGEGLPLGIALRLVSDTCSALHAAHELCDENGRSLQVVHRDVSPQNILVSVQGVTKLIDFGIARARSRLTSDTQAGVLKGKVVWMAPEQVTRTDIDRRADVWSLGAVLYNLVAGRPPYHGENQLMMMHRLLSIEPPEPLPPHVPQPVRAIVTKALTHDPEGRYETAAAMKVAIDSFASQMRLNPERDEVALFVAKVLADPIRERQESFREALRAASQRARFENSIEAQESSGTGSVNLFVVRNRPPLGEPARSDVPTLMAGHSPPPPPFNAPPERSSVKSPLAPSETEDILVDSSDAEDADMDEMGAAASRRRSRVRAGVVITLVACVVVIVLAFMLRARHTDAQAQQPTLPSQAVQPGLHVATEVGDLASSSQQSPAASSALSASGESGAIAQVDAGSVARSAKQGASTKVQSSTPKAGAFPSKKNTTSGGFTDDGF